MSLLKELPTDPANLKQFNNWVDEVVDNMLQIKGFEEIISSVKESCEEKQGISGAYLVKVAKIRYDSLYNENKSNNTKLADAELVETVNSKF